MVVNLENAVVDVDIHTESHVSSARYLVHSAIDVKLSHDLGQTHVASDVLSAQSQRKEVPHSVVASKYGSLEGRMHLLDVR